MELEDKFNRVLKKVRLCMGSLVGGSGHMASFGIVPDTFHITAIEQMEGGMRRYRFTAEAYYESEFTEYTEDYTPETQSLSGSIVLDRAYNLVRDQSGRVMLEPWTCSLPPEWE